MAQCPGCSSKRSKPHAEVSGVRVCAKCGALFTERAIYKGESFQLVLPQWDTAEAPEERYFDLEVLGSQGLERRHGWYNPATQRITQVG